MDPDDLQPRKKLPDIVLGEDISALSAHELEQRIARLEEEVARCRQAIAARHQVRGGKFLQEVNARAASMLIRTAGMWRAGDGKRISR